MTIDPSDDCTFWFTSEYIPTNGAFNWSTRIGSFKLPGCGAVVANDFSISANPTSLNVVQGSSGTGTISTAVTSGSAGTVNLSASGVPAGASASLSPASVTAGGSSTLTLNAGTAAAGTYTITVTGIEGSNTHNATVSLTVTAPVVNDFSIAASPTTLNVVQGSSGTSTISTAVISGNAATVNLSTSGVPVGASASLSPASVTAGGSSTLTLNAGTATPGTYTITITGIEGSNTHSTTVSLTITAPVVNDFSISASPASLTVAQGSGGGSTISTAVISGNAQTVSLSVSGVPAGASAGVSPSSVTSGQSATLTVNSGSAAPGTYSLTVTGTGTTLTHATSVSLTITATKLSSTVQLSASPNPALLSQTVIFTAMVSSPVGGTPTGTVKFKQGGVLVATVPLGGGVATFTKTYPTAGSFLLQASYSGDTQYLASNSTTLKETVTLNPVTVAVSSDTNPSVYGQTVTFTAMLTTPGPALDGQTVTFGSGGVVLGSVTISGGIASFSTTALNVGKRGVKATYAGDAVHKAGSGSVIKTVTKAPTTAVLTSDLNPSTLGSDVTFTVTVSSATGVPTGTVAFKMGSMLLGTGALSGGVATLTTNTLPKGTRAIVASYSNANFATSASTLMQTVQ